MVVAALVVSGDGITTFSKDSAGKKKKGNNNNDCGLHGVGVVCTRASAWACCMCSAGGVRVLSVGMCSGDVLG